MREQAFAIATCRTHSCRFNHNSETLPTCLPLGRPTGRFRSLKMTPKEVERAPSLSTQSASESMTVRTCQHKVQVLIISVQFASSSDSATLRTTSDFATASACPFWQLHCTPWPLLDVEHCSLLHQCHHFRCVFDPSSPEDRFLPPKKA